MNDRSTERDRRRIVRTVRNGGRVEAGDLDELSDVIETLRVAGILVTHVMILHDDGCSVARCICTPTYAIEKLTAKRWLAGARAQEGWIVRSAEAQA